MFVRAGQSIRLLDEEFSSAAGLDQRTRPNALFLSVCAQFNLGIAVAMQKWFAERLQIVSGLDDELLLPFTIGQCKTSEGRRKILEFVRSLDVGIEKIEVRTIPLGESIPKGVPEKLRKLLSELGGDEAQSLSTTHTVFSPNGEATGAVEFDLQSHESRGTQKALALAGPILDTLARGNVLVVDELEARLHPLLTAAMVGLFNSPEANRSGAQLVFTSHDTNLLDQSVLRRDQVWFCEKDRRGSTALFSLLEFRSKPDSAIEKRYLEGRYGAVPILRTLIDAVAELE